MEFIQKSIEVEYLNPIKAYLAVREKDTYILQSIGGEGKKARFTIIGFSPLLRADITDGKVKLSGKLAKDIPEIKENDTFLALERLSGELSCKKPITGQFAGGLVGSLAYDVVSEKVKLEKGKRSTGVPHASFVLCRFNLIFDHVEHKSILLETKEDCDLSELDSARLALQKETLPPKKCIVGEFKDVGGKEDFEESVRKAKHYIREGDIFQAVVSRRVVAKYSGDPFYSYLKLLSINPSPYMYYLDLGTRQIVGSSPETLVRVEGKTVYTYPIAGTRKRGENAIDDSEIERELSLDKKEQSEHIMLVDLGRNDIGRVSEYGSVEVTKFMEPEYFSHVIHLSSEVKGTLKKDCDAIGALKATFPAGTVSGAPKVRAMEIISELEPEARGEYAGCVGYIGLNGNLDMAITIRTLVFSKGKIFAQAGAGIVADSVPALEFKETENKSRVLLNALKEDKS